MIWGVFFSTRRRVPRRKCYKTKIRDERMRRKDVRMGRGGFRRPRVVEQSGFSSEESGIGWLVPGEREGHVWFEVIEFYFRTPWYHVTPLPHHAR